MEALLRLWHERTTPYELKRARERGYWTSASRPTLDQTRDRQPGIRLESGRHRQTQPLKACFARNRCHIRSGSRAALPSSFLRLQEQIRSEQDDTKAQGHRMPRFLRTSSLDQTCTQLLACSGADVIKSSAPGWLYYRGSLQKAECRQPCISPCSTTTSSIRSTQESQAQGSPHRLE